jgi:hypothetical protein
MNIDNPYIITYSNHLFFEGRRLAFRKQELFDITNSPIHIPFKDKYWIVNRKQLTKLKAKELLINTPITVDISTLNWDLQCHLDGVFNLQ